MFKKPEAIQGSRWTPGSQLHRGRPGTCTTLQYGNQGQDEKAQSAEVLQRYKPT